MSNYVIALYISLSLEDTKYDSLSIQNQHLILNEFALSMPEAAHAEIMEFTDNGFSGTNFERPDVQRLIEMVRENKIDCIIVKDFSRFGRNSIETGYFIERVFPLYHTRFISVSDDFDSAKFKGDTGGMDVAFKYLINEYYSRDMSIKTKSAKYTRMQRGEYQSKICPYGYRKSADGRMEPDPEAAAVVRQIFELAVGGTNATQIACKLYRQGTPTPGEYKAAAGNHSYDISRTRGIWSNSTVLRILEDERYTGTYVIGKRAVLEVGGTRSRRKDRDKWYIIPDHHPAIVEKELYEQVQRVICRFSIPHKKQHDYPLKGKAYCGCCDHALSRIMQKSPIFYCRHSEADTNAPCHGMQIGVAELEQLVFTVLKKQMEVVLGMGETELPALEAGLARQAEYEQQISSLQDAKRRLYEQYLMREIGLDEYKSQKAECDAKLVQIKNTCAAVTAQAKQAQEQREEQIKQKQIIREISQADGLTASLVDLLIEKVYVFPGKRIEIAYKVSEIKNQNFGEITKKR